MPPQHIKPDYSLRKANDLVRVGKTTDALVHLREVLTSKRHRVWAKILEDIMIRYLELSVELRQNVKDAMMQYRQICQPLQGQPNIASLEKVMAAYRDFSEAKAAAAQKEANVLNGRSADAKSIVAVDELDETPESINLQAVSGEDSKDRKDRQILTPWIKYLWETYRTILDVLRNNSKLQLFYQAIARQGFEFCKKYGRTVEFRRLCETLRNHILQMAKYTHQPNAVDLNSPETQSAYLETRFEQLKIASDLELWQEAYRTIEDIHKHMRLCPTPPRAALMKTYYEKLAAIFLASDNYLFHAYSLHKFYMLQTQPEEKEAFVDDPILRGKLASAVLLATLVIPPSERFGTDEAYLSPEHEGNLRLANLLGFKKETPTRVRLLQSLIQTDVLVYASDDAKMVYELVEKKFGPLSLKSELTPVLDRLAADDLKIYVDPIKNLAVLRLLQQLSTVFKSMRIPKFITLAPAGLSFGAIERLIMNAIKADQLRVQIDHRNQLIQFLNDGFEASRMRLQLSSLAQKLQKISEKLHPPRVEDKQKEREDVFTLVKDALEGEHQAVFRRQDAIEKRKELHEKTEAQKERELAEAKNAENRTRAAEEKARLEREHRNRENERENRERKAHDLKMKLTIAQRLKGLVDSKQNASEKVKKEATRLASEVEQLASQVADKAPNEEAPEVKIERNQLIDAERKLLEDERLATERRRREEARTLTFTTRAIRIEEKELLIKQAEEKLLSEKEQSENDFLKYLEQHKQQHQKGLEEKKRLSRIAKERKILVDKIIARRREIFEAQAAKEAEKRARKRAEQLREERRREEEEKKRQEEEERLQREEDERLAEEERKRQEAAEIARKKKEAAEEARKKADEAAAKQRKREADLEEADRQKRAGLTSARPSGDVRSSEPYRPPRRGDDDPPRRVVERDSEGPRKRDDEGRPGEQRWRDEGGNARPWKRPGDRETDRPSFSRPRRPDDDRERAPVGGGGGRWRREADRGGRGGEGDGGGDRERDAEAEPGKEDSANAAPASANPDDGEGEPGAKEGGEAPRWRSPRDRVERGDRDRVDRTDRDRSDRDGPRGGGRAPSDWRDRPSDRSFDRSFDRNDPRGPPRRFEDRRGPRRDDDRNERPERTERTERTERSERTERPERSERTERSERGAPRRSDEERPVRSRATPSASPPTSTRSAREDNDDGPKPKPAPAETKAPAEAEEPGSSEGAEGFTVVGKKTKEKKKAVAGRR